MKNLLQRTPRRGEFPNGKRGRAVSRFNFIAITCAPMRFIASFRRSALYILNASEFIYPLVNCAGREIRLTEWNYEGVRRIACSFLFRDARTDINAHSIFPYPEYPEYPRITTRATGKFTLSLEAKWCLRDSHSTAAADKAMNQMRSYINVGDDLACASNSNN